MVKLSVIYYFATGHGTTMARRVADASEKARAEVRLRHVAERMIHSHSRRIRPGRPNYEATNDLPAVTGDHIVWAHVAVTSSLRTLRERRHSTLCELQRLIETARTQLADDVSALVIAVDHRHVIHTAARRRITASADASAAAAQTPHRQSCRCARNWCNARSIMPIVSGWPENSHCRNISSATSSAASAASTRLVCPEPSAAVRGLARIWHDPQKLASK